ncbi:hypothetical protein [Gordonia sp. (in: high G+C Gram-positive bacteria)]|uniref:hypothetical protein n=1 Tax=Gordonia sp. (in: high G+C Gram-positive bacteria) TaxID=84139 RepID=UPI0016BA2D06|nr:hypothetical protein [Gordonia sp. (in: high G+C Gram-positive bacteria)]NLG47738.1 hypothetical protein [Gordonia sp. (in: high G+C Gram-positive bacteria)]
MTTADHHPESSTRPPAGFRDASPHELFVDCCRLGPAPTRSRELFVIGVSAVLLAVLFAILTPTAGFVVAVTCFVVLYMVGRWVVGTRTKWAKR